MIADITLHIALIVDIEERKTGVVLVLGTHTTVEWAASFDRSECYFGKIWFLQVFIARSVVVEVRRNHSPDFSTGRTKFS